MVEISSSGSGEGPSWATTRPTLQRPFHLCPPAARRRRQLLLACGDGGVLSARSGAVASFYGRLERRCRRV
jgi:hypothetical protein